MNSVCQALTAGEFALRELRTGQAGQVNGVTSAGAFVRAGASGRIIFITRRERRGPLSMNLGGQCPALEELRNGAPARLEGGNLILPESGLAIHAEQLTGWQPPAADRAAAAPPAERQARLSALASEMLRGQQGKGFSGLLATWCGEAQPETRAGHPAWIELAIQQARSGLLARNPAASAPALARLLGYGPGLTPSGDDFVLGVCLLLNRWLAVDWGSAALGALNRAVAESARQATTALSASLIECAAQGQADEYLVMAADYLMTGQGDEPAIREGLLSWGSSSGIDALAGMALVIDSI